MGKQKRNRGGLLSHAQNHGLSPKSYHGKSLEVGDRCEQMYIFSNDWLLGKDKEKENISRGF